MSLRNIPYAAQTAPTMVELDQTFADVSACTIVPCTAAGTNAITLTPLANTPTISAYANYLAFSFVAANTSTGAVTVQVGALAPINLYLGDAVTQAGNNSLVINVLYTIQFNSALNGGLNGFQLVSANLVPSSLPVKTTPTSADSIVIMDAAAANVAKTATIPNVLSAIITSQTSSIGADVPLNNISNYFDGPVITQGSGTWFVSGTITLASTTGDFVQAKLWDGTTVMASAESAVVASSFITITLSGVLAAPAANIRISAKDPSSTNGLIKFNASGNSKDSTITGIRIG